MRRWEYRTIKLETTGWFKGGKLDEAQLDSQMNALGAEGWEAVSSFDTNIAGGESRDVVVIFKREVFSAEAEK